MNNVDFLNGAYSSVQPISETNILSSGRGVLAAQQKTASNTVNDEVNKQSVSEESGDDGEFTFHKNDCLSNE